MKKFNLILGFAILLSACERIVELEKGDILFFHAHLIHYAKKNMSNIKEYKYRRAIYLKYIKNGFAFWPGWTERRQLIDRDDFNKKIIF